MGILSAVEVALGIGGKLIDRLFPDPEQKAKAQLELMKLTQDGELKELELSMSAIVAEAKSSDPWTSRARPTFLYVVYLMILAAIPMGVLSAFKPDLAIAVAKGMQAWLSSIPDGLWATFGIGYSGYSIARSWDKKSTAATKK
ncbi:MAG: holin family protein [Desulfobacteraceae bacterium]|nr:holin family protein [Desulfobacteraceae bacterium]